MSVLRPAEHRVSWQEKKRILSKLYDRGGLIVVCETGVVVHEAPANSGDWKVEDFGVPTIISNLNELIISIVDFDTAEPHREYSITAECDYQVQKSYFHTFICEDDDGSDLLVGLSFANEEVARRVAEAVDQLTPGKLFKGKRRSLTKDYISQPSDFRHIAHVGSNQSTLTDPELRMEVEMGSPPNVTKSSPSQGTKMRRQTPPHGLYTQAKRLLSGTSGSKKSEKGGRRVLDISSPMELKHVAHVGGDTCFAPKNEKGEDDPFQMSGDFSGAAAERKRSKTSSSSSEQVLSSEEEPESKKTKVPMKISGPQDFHHIAHVSKDTAISAFLLTGKKDPFSIVTAIANSSSPPRASSSPPKTPSSPRKTSASSPPIPPSPPKIPTPPEPLSLPNLKPVEPRKVTSPPKINFPPPPAQMDHSKFLQEISNFKPSLLRHVSVTKNEPLKDPNSLQEILKHSFENMRSKLQNYWQESIVTTFTDQLDCDDEFDFPGVYLPKEILKQLEQ